MLELGMRLGWYCIDYRQGWKQDVHVCSFTYMNFDLHVIIDQKKFTKIKKAVHFSTSYTFSAWCVYCPLLVLGVCIAPC